MKKRSVVVLVLLEHRAVAIENGDGVFGFVHHLGHKVQISGQVECPAFLHIKIKVILIAFALLQIAFLGPVLVGVNPKMLKQTDAIHRLSLQ